MALYGFILKHIWDVLTREGVPRSRVKFMRGNEGPLLTASSYLHGGDWAVNV